jgi:hypothetical protein
LPFDDLEAGFGQATHQWEDPGKFGFWQNSGAPGRDSVRVMRRAVFKYLAKWSTDGHGRFAVVSRISPAEASDSPDPD